MDSAAVRQALVETLALDLIGPEPGSPLEREALNQPPSRWYLSGFLIPHEAPEDQRADDTGQETIDSATGGGTDDGEAPDPPSARKAHFPSSLGLSVLVAEAARSVHVRVTWGDYRLVEDELAAGASGSAPAPEAASPTEPRRTEVRWQREPRAAEVEVPIGRDRARPKTFDVPGSDGLRLTVSVRSTRPVQDAAGQVRLVPPGTRAVSVFLVNNREPKPAERKDEAMVFQATLNVRCEHPFVPRPDVSGRSADDWDAKVADLQYRDTFEVAVGHGVATRAVGGASAGCREVETTWVPRAEVEKVVPAEMPGVELGMEALAQLASAAEARDKLGVMVSGYRAWIAAQRAAAPVEDDRAEVARGLLDDAESIATRLEGGLQELDAPDVLEAFRLANRVMAISGRQRVAQLLHTTPAAVAAPRWRPFQLAFLLMNLRGLAQPTNREREIVDLLFFPTGGGKTEAYLGLAAYTLVLRRLRNPGDTAAGVSILMRYTLRLLTLDQLSRAATLICALELERQQAPDKLGTWPFEIGLWVGKAATPNKMGQVRENDPTSARSRVIAYKNNDKKPIPIPIENCPWCGTRFSPNSFTLTPTRDQPRDLRIVCVSPTCAFKGNRPLPIIAVDEPLYRRLPCFVIATIDKFASLAFEGRVGGLFGKVDRHDSNGFYGPCDPGLGQPLTRPLLPPDLIIQDELHLISGPLGTMTGLYESAIEALATRTQDGHEVRPKIVASTATVRRAVSQIRALFARPNVAIFPAPGPDLRDSCFARTVPREEANARQYVGVAAPGRSLKVVMLRTYLALLAASQRLWDEAGGARNATNPVDPYMTLLGYFNALRELGGSRRIVEDEVTARVAAYADRKRLGQDTGAFANREVRAFDDLVELTSRESTDKVATAKRRLAAGYHEKDSVDIALATNMISVGLDISRLGLMVVLGQPKTTAEYIQATSRVGRDDQRPGLVVTLLHVHKPRDRSHYERFEAYHHSFYRAVEVTSVTPFSPRAIDRGLAGVTVGLVRHSWPRLTAATSADQMPAERAQLAFVADVMARRAASHGLLVKEEEEALRQKVRGRVIDLLDEWSRIAREKRGVGARLRYQRYDEGTGPYLLYDPLDPELAKQPAGPRKFRAHRSLRDVEPNVGVFLKRLDGVDVPAPEEAE